MTSAAQPASANIANAKTASVRPNVPVSAAIIVLNERRQLRSLVSALHQVVDEIVFVDGGSTDGTAELAAELGCRVLVHPFDTFAAQRNRAKELCRGEWVLSIDADERPTPAMAAELRELISDGEFSAYRVPIRSRIFGRRMRFSGTQDDRPVRFFRKDSARWQGDVHERLAVGGRVSQLQTHLEHTTLPDLASFLRKMDRYTTLEAQARRLQGRRSRWRDRWCAPSVEFGRRFLWKGGLLDGPEGWAFCALSGISKWIEADKLRRLWRSETRPLTNAANGSVGPRPECAVTDDEAMRVLRGIPKSMFPLLQESPSRK